MQVTFYDAVREVTGSMHMVTTASDSILPDCGIFRGTGRKASGKTRFYPSTPGNHTLFCRLQACVRPVASWGEGYKAVRL